MRNLRTVVLASFFVTWAALGSPTFISAVAQPTVQEGGTTALRPSVQVIVEGEEPPSEVTVVGPPLTEDGLPTEEAVTLSAGRGQVDWTRPPPGKTWTIRARAEGYWSAGFIVEPDAEALRLELWPATRLVARVLGDQGPIDADDLRIRLESPPDLSSRSKQPGAGAEVECGLERGELKDCVIPRGRWDFRIEAPGFAPRYLWDVRAEAPEAVDLGSLELRRGGSIVGRIITEEGPADPEHTKVVLRPFVDRGRMTVDQEVRLDRLVRETGITANGYFQFVGVPAGTFSIEAEQPGFSKASRAPVEVEMGRWTELEGVLEMPLPLTLSLRLDPPAGPYETPWSVTLYQPVSSESYATVAEGETSIDGTWDSPPLAEGEYALQVSDEQGNKFAWQEVEVLRGSSSVDLEIPVVYVDGRVLLDGEPLESQVWFGGRSGSERVEAAADEEGAFFVVLPRDGVWVVDVVAEDPPVTSRDLEVSVEPRRDVHAAAVTIEVPNTLVTGIVVDEAGLPPASPARVELVPSYHEGHPAATEAGPRGEFEIVGMSPGSYAVEAVSGDASADATAIELQEDLEVSLRLVVRPQKTVAGRVVSTGGPVPYALVVGYPLASFGPPPTSWTPSARTEADGGFRFRVPAGTDRLRLITMALGFVLDVHEVSKGSTLQVELSSTGGALVVPPEVLSKDSDGVSLVLIDGAPIELSRLFQWAQIQGSEPSERDGLVVPGMPAGRYSLCRLERQEGFLVLIGSALPTTGSCSEGFLPPNGELTLGPPG